jgi:hypothetical protein
MVHRCSGKKAVTKAHGVDKTNNHSHLTPETILMLHTWYGMYLVLDTKRQQGVGHRSYRGATTIIHMEQIANLNYLMRLCNIHCCRKPLSSEIA